MFLRTSVDFQRSARSYIPEDSTGSVFKLVSCSANYSNLKMEAICSSETSVDFQRTTRRYTPEDSILHNHRCENLKSNQNIVQKNKVERRGKDSTLGNPW
jgi:hypothetical protein